MEKTGCVWARFLEKNSSDRRSPASLEATVTIQAPNLLSSLRLHWSDCAPQWIPCQIPGFSAFLNWMACLGHTYRWQQPHQGWHSAWHLSSTSAVSNPWEGKLLSALGFWFCFLRFSWVVLFWPWWIKVHRRKGTVGTDFSVLDYQSCLSRGKLCKDQNRAGLRAR